MEIEGALNFTSRHVLDLNLEVKDQGHFELKKKTKKNPQDHI